MENQSKDDLLQEIERLKKINKALMEKNEKSNSRPESLGDGQKDTNMIEGEINRQTKSLKETAEFLASEKSKLRNILTSLPGAILIIDEKLDIQNSYFNGFNTNAISHIVDLKSQEFTNDFKRVLLANITIYNPNLDSVAFEYQTAYSEKGHFIHCAISKVSTRKFTLFLLDKTEQVRKDLIIQRQQNQLNQLANLSSMGEMAGNIAHEINTPLCTIMMIASSLSAKSKILSAEDLKTNAEKIQNTVGRISKIIQGLRYMSRSGEKDDSEKTNLFTLIEEAVELSQYQFRHYKIKTNIECDKKLFVYGKRVQLMQVFINLFNNSFFAIREQENPWTRVSVKVNADQIEIWCIDSGHGISEKVKRRLFEPFFTTKGVSQGTGLGMSISRRIIEDHQGSLEYKPYEGNTGFLIALPSQFEENKDS